MEDKRNMSAEEMMKSATEGNHDKKPKNKKVRLAIIVGVVLSLVFVGFGVRAVLQIRSNQDIKQEGKIDDDFQDVNTIYSNQKYPVSVPSWAKTPYGLSLDDLSFFENEKNKMAAIEWSRYSAIGEIAQVLPPASAGYTADEEEMLTETDALNVWYSYLLDEHIEYAVSTYVHRLINPTFGSWSSTQLDTTDFEFNALQDMFTKEWIEANVKDGDYSKVPVFANFANDWDYKFNQSIEVSEGVFFGEVDVNEMSGDFVPDEERGIASVSINVPVTYKAFAEGDPVITGTLKLTLVPNFEDSLDYEHRFLISEASLDINK